MTAVSFTFDQDKNPITLWRDSDGALQFRHNDECFNVGIHHNYLRCELNLSYLSSDTGKVGKFSVLLLYADECRIVRIGESKIESHKYEGGGMLILQPRCRYRVFFVSTHKKSSGLIPTHPNATMCVWKFTAFRLIPSTMLQ